MRTPDEPLGDGGARVELHHFRADGLGLPAFPVGTGPEMDLGEHVMGVVVIAWLTHLPVSQWGPAWASSGEIEVRFRAHLTARTPLTTVVTRAADHLTMVIQDIDGNVAATATAGTGRGVDLDAPGRDGRPGGVRVAALHDLLRDRELRPITFEFDADRDLAFTAGIPDRDVWRSHGGPTPPGWLAGRTLW